jgi:hypothetical protein
MARKAELVVNLLAGQRPGRGGRSRLTAVITAATQRTEGLQPIANLVRCARGDSVRNSRREAQEHSDSYCTSHPRAQAFHGAYSNAVLQTGGKL